MARTTEKTPKRIWICTSIIAFIMSALLLVLFLWVKANYVKTIELTLQCGETYEIGSAKPEERDYARLAQTSFESTDETVATLLAGYIINTQSPGEAVLTLTKDGETTRYHVIVTEDDDRAMGTRYVWHDPSTFNSGRIGYGFNALQYDEVNKNTIAAEVLDWKKVVESNQLYYDESNLPVMNFYGGTSFSGFRKDLEQKTEHEICVKIFGKKYSEKKESFQVNTEDNASIEVWGQITYDVVTGTYYMEYTNKLLIRCLKDDAKSALYGEKALDPEALFEKYGTHIITGGHFGGKALYNYRISDSAEESASITNKKNELMEWYGADKVKDHYEERLKHYSIKTKSLYKDNYYEIIRKMSWFRFDYAGDHIDGYYTDWENGNIHVSSYLRLFGSHWFTEDQNEGASAIDPYTAIAMMNKLGIDDLDIRSEDFIGPRDEKSMYPIWDLIPQNSEENIARRTELIKYYYSKIGA